jgi:hypoxanthine phosphoribosyltransferase
MILVHMTDDIQKVLFHESTILARLDELADRIVRDYRGKDVTVVGILNGSCLFLGDLLRRIPLPLKVDCLSVASYHGGTKSSGTVAFRQSDLPDVAGRHVLLVDDILDTGRTLAAVKGRFEAEGAAKDVRSCVLLKKDIPREEFLTSDYVGFEIPNEFVVGYGLDYMGHYRNLPYIGVLNEAAIARKGARHL